MPDELLEILYRERFGLSAIAFEDEPAEAVEYWASVEAARNTQKQKK